MTGPLKLFAALGPGDIVDARRRRLAGDAINETSIAFSEQLFAYCRHRSVKTLAISSNPRIDQLDDGVVSIENRPKPLRHGGGLRFHVSQVLYGLYLAFRAWRFGATIAVIDSGSTHYFVLILFRMLGIAVAVNLHNVLWPSGYPPQGVGAIIRKWNQMFFRYAALGAIGVSPECERQVALEARGGIPFFQYRCQFRSDGFASAAPYQGGRPFRVIFAGRVEENKGALDIAQMARDLRRIAPGAVVFDICGDGPSLPKLREIVERENLGNSVIIRGRLERQDLLRVYATSHAVIVPTRSNFSEGMPQVCAEAVLSSLPVITSQVSNAFDVIGGAIIRAKTNDVGSYIGAILSLANEPDTYTKLRDACRSLSTQFFDRSQSYPAALHRLLELEAGKSSSFEFDQIFD